MEITGIKVREDMAYNGPWRPALIDHTKVNGVWKDVVSVWTKIAGEWVSDLKDITFNINFNYGSITPSVAIGNFAYTDGSFSETLDTNKTCIGFVVDIVDNKCKVFSCKRACPKDTNIAWGDFVSSLPVISTSRPIARADMDGRINTNIILSEHTVDNPQPTTISDYPAANYCNNYSVAGFPKGSWYLPSCGECYKASLLWSSMKPIFVANGFDVPQSQYIWTSTGYTTSNPAWIYDLNDKTSGENLGGNSNPYGIYDVFPMTEIDITNSSEEATLTFDNKTITSHSPITVKGRLNHTYNYIVSKNGFTQQEGSLTVEGNEDIDISLSALVKQQKRFYPAGGVPYCGG